MTSIAQSTRSRLVERLAYVFRHDVATAGTGTVTTDGTTAIVGSGTAFLTEYSAGDYIQITTETVRHIVDVVSDDENITLTVAASTSTAGLAHSGGQGLFEYFGGFIGSGSIDSPEIESRIQAWPVEDIGETLRDWPTLTVQAVRPSGVFAGLPTGRDLPTYEIMATYFMRTLPMELVAGELNSDDVFMRIRDAALNGENVEVPGKLLDPLNTERALNIFLSALNEEPVRRYKDVTLYPMRFAYTCRENIRTGELI